MRYIFKYEKFIIESNNDKLNEEIIGWITDSGSTVKINKDTN